MPTMTDTTYSTTDLDVSPVAPSHSGAARAAEFIAGGALAGVAAIHLLDLSGKFEEVPYLGVAYVGLIVGVVVATVLLLKRSRYGWILGGGLALATMVGFVLSRTTGLPGSTDDIGNWSELLGKLSLLTEGLIVLLAAFALRRRPAD